jgi:molybdopterin molybdotransferase
VDLVDARRVVLDAVAPLAPRRLRLDATLGCVTAYATVASSELPPFTNAAMDGYALHSADTAAAPTRLRVVDAITAGRVASVPVRRGEAARIMTGAPMPPDVDAVVPRELTEVDGGVVVVLERVAAGAYVRPAGSDIAPGQELFPAGTTITPRHIGVLAGLGVDTVEVVPRPRVGVLSTGDELVEALGRTSPGMVRDANRPALLALLRQANFQPTDLGLVGDDAEAIAGAIGGGAARCDAVLTSGGVSVGEVDLVKDVLDMMSGGTMHWLQVAIKPAKPFAFGLLKESGVPVFGLAGNPVSALVGFELFVLPALRKMGGHRRIDRPILSARASLKIRREPDGKLHLVRVVVEADARGDLWVHPSGGQGSHMSLAMAHASGLALVPDGDGIVAGQGVDVLILDDRGPDGVVTTLEDTLRGLR